MDSNAGNGSDAVRVLILGAAGRDFHNYNMFFRDNADYQVVAFTATQIPDIDGRKYPTELAGELYPEGIPIYAEDNLEKLIVDEKIEQVVLAYSDLSYDTVMHLCSRVNAAGADFRLMGTDLTSAPSTVPVVSVCAVRTGCGKSQTTRRVVEILQGWGNKVVAIRHPMPYGDLVAQRVQRFAVLEDLDKHECTIEEREEYEPHIVSDVVVYAGVDYEAILREAEKEADVIVWDGGNNDFSLIKSDLEIVVVDPHRPGHEVSYYPGETNLRRADVVVINKIDTADHYGVEMVRDNIRAVNPDATVVDGASPLFVEDGDQITGKRVLVVEDGPTLTHGEMAYGAGYMAAIKYGADDVVDPRPYAVGTIADTYEKYPTTGDVLPAMGYGADQTKELEETINATPCDLVIIGTPIDLRRIINIDVPAVRVTYELQEIGMPTLEAPLKEFCEKKGVKSD